MKRLPIDDAIPEIIATIGEARAAVITAPPGSGKTTRVPPALVADGPVIVLQPRRIAARALARRIASERGWREGEEVGWHIRGDRRFNPNTKLIVATEGILTARLLRDPLLEQFRTVILDEFHERTIHADMALSLARQAWEARDDLRLVVMSATLDSRPVSEFLDDCPVIDVPGRAYPVEISYRPQQDPIDAAREACESTTGHVLVFLPGAREIERAARSLSGGRDLFRLYGAMSPADQDAALADHGRPKLVLATNIAETSLTIDGVTHVVDGGTHKLLRHDRGSGLDRLELERIPQDAADQRAGRAGRTAPGEAWRLWDSRDELRPHREPELCRVDLAVAVLDICVWGEDPHRFSWFEPPETSAITNALTLLQRLGAVEGVQVTDLGRQMRRLALHPRLARMVCANPGSREIRVAAVALAEGWRPNLPAAHGDSDLHGFVDHFRDAPRSLRHMESDLKRRSASLREPEETSDFLHAVFLGYADRVARRRKPLEDRFLLMSGDGATLDRRSHVLDADWVVAVDSMMSRTGRHADGETVRIHRASAIDPAWLAADRRVVESYYDAESQSVRGLERGYYGNLVLEERIVDVDDASAADLLVNAWSQEVPGDDDEQLQRRLDFAGLTFDFTTAFRHHVWGQRSLPETTRHDLLPYELRRDLDRRAPSRWKLPSGNHASIVYRQDRSITSGVKLQELFGLFETPKIGPRETPLTLELRAPNGRVVQTTDDLASFWKRGYAEVRKELRGRYPKHPWPEDPATAEPTAKTRRRGRN
ncbi:MAG: helicase-related protein [Acidobacteriota bacterium]|nr:helicase-related protein [Acidobacteriota bacterium]MDH3784206.1 helicase-related protein [Acidobacteriota bacterium]